MSDKTPSSSEPGSKRHKKSAASPPAGDEFVLSGDFRNATINIKSTLIGTAEVKEIESLPPEPGDPPYQGLQYFSEGAANRFYGRELLTARIINRLNQTRFLAVIGASGSGKSSLIRAGVIPALRKGNRLADGTLPPLDSENWEIRILTPSAHPLEALTASLSNAQESADAIHELQQEMVTKEHSLSQAGLKLLSLQSKKHLFLLIDQFEEVFTQCYQEEERNAFISNILSAVNPHETGAITILITLRADFYEHLAHYDALREMVSQQQEFIGAMSRDELMRAIIQPAAAGNWKIQEGLVELILDDIGTEPGSLPLLSHALLETWKRRRGRTMTLSGYTECGGVRGAIAQTAESVFRQRLSLEQQPVARMIFMRLAELGDDSPDSRRRASYSELITRSTDLTTIEVVLQILTDSRLVTTDTLEPGDVKVVEIAHEALIREWPTLRNWLNENREGLILHRHISDDVNNWLRLDRDPDSLYRGVRLKQAMDWANQNPTLLSLTEQEFLDASQQNEKAEAEQERKLRRAARYRLLVIPAVVIAALGILAILYGTKLINKLKTPAQMNGVYNIAVSEFGLVNPDGTISKTNNQAGQAISGWVANDLQSELKGDANLLVWHDSPELDNLNVTIGRVEGSQTQQKIESAAALAKRLKADMVIFGNIDTQKTPAQLILEVWIAPQNNYQFQDIQGGFQSEEPVPIVNPSNPGMETQPEIKRQASTIAWLAIGLTRMQLGQSAEALDAFLKAETFSPISENVQFFVGREYLFLSDRDPSQQEDYTKNAEDHFKKALSINPQFARAPIGLGSVYFARAKRLVSGLKNNSEDSQNLSQALIFVNQAITFYNQTLNLHPDPSKYGIPIDLVAKLGIGTSYRLRAEINQRLGKDDESSKDLDQSIQLLESIRQPLAAAHQDRYLAQTYQTLGTAYQWKAFLAEREANTKTSVNNLKQAVQNYDQCITMGNSSPDLIIKNDIAAKFCVPFRKDVQEKINSLVGGGS